MPHREWARSIRSIFVQGSLAGVLARIPIGRVGATAAVAAALVFRFRPDAHGPFTEAKGLIAGCCLWQVRSMDVDTARSVLNAAAG